MVLIIDEGIIINQNISLYTPSITIHFPYKLISKRLKGTLRYLDYILVSHIVPDKFFFLICEWLRLTLSVISKAGILREGAS